MGTDTPQAGVVWLKKFGWKGLRIWIWMQFIIGGPLGPTWAQICGLRTKLLGEKMQKKCKWKVENEKNAICIHSPWACPGSLFILGSTKPCQLEVTADVKRFDWKADLAWNQLHCQSSWGSFSTRRPGGKGVGTLNRAHRCKSLGKYGGRARPSSLTPGNWYFATVPRVNGQNIR